MGKPRFSGLYNLLSETWNNFTSKIAQNTVKTKQKFVLKYVKQYEKNCGKNLHKFELIPDVSTQFKHPNILPDPFKK